MELIGELLRYAALAVDAGLGSTASVKRDRGDVVTATDKTIGRELVGRIRARFPHHDVIDEESGVTGAGSAWTWVVDPIDGTSNFAAGSPLFGTVIGLLHEGVPVAGGVMLPRFGETYLAERGGGAWLNGTRLPLAQVDDLESGLVAVGVDVADLADMQRDLDLAAAIADRCRGLRMSNSVFDLMMVARGAYGGFVHGDTRIWDIVGPQVILEEAGCTCTGLLGEPIDYRDVTGRHRARFTICAAGAAVAPALADVVREWAGSVAR